VEGSTLRIGPVERGVDTTEEAIITAKNDLWNNCDMMVVGGKEKTLNGRLKYCGYFVWFCLNPVWTPESG
jgi:hypothetical protein